MSASPDPHTATGLHNSPPTILLTGGGSGGHITPLLAVAHQLKQQKSDLKLVYVGQRGEKLTEVVERSPDIDQVVYIWAGKWRRYHGEGWRQILDVVTLTKNVRDAFRLLRGTWQSYRLLGHLRPVGIFMRGGFVGVPVGIAARWRHVPYVTHDSDAVPSLASRLIGRWAAAHAVALPAELYPYPPAKTHYVGVPIAEEFQPVTAALQQQYRKELGLSTSEPVILVTGGGLGAQRVNEAVVRIAPKLMELYPKLAIIHATGPDHQRVITTAYEAILSPADHQRVHVEGYIQDMYRYSGAADVIITRAGATNLAEWAAQGKACIVIPNPLLTGGHQLKNTQAFVNSQAIVQVTENDLATKDALLTEVRQLIDNPGRRQELAANIAKFAKPHASADLAKLLLTSFKLPGREG